MRAFFIIAILMLASCNPKTKAVDSNPNKGQSTLTYAKHIDVQCYIVTREQLGEFLNQENPSITQLPTKELPHGLDVYFLIRVKNTGDMAASGILHCFVPSCGYPIPIKIMKMPKKAMKRIMNEHIGNLPAVLAAIREKNGKHTKF